MFNWDIIVVQVVILLPAFASVFTLTRHRSHKRLLNWYTSGFT